jgi:hypothetical protein
MKLVGVVALCLVGLGVVAALVMLVMSLPDIKRYMKMRAM